MTTVNGIDVALIGLDWGSTNLRAYAFDSAGKVVESRTSQAGALTLSGDDAFDSALRNIVAPWVSAAITAPLIACGMVGSKSGWREAVYCAAGADAGALARHTLRVETSLGVPLAIIPGIRSDEPDVMRGEETQLVGCGIDQGVVVLPGTHSKWVELRAGAVASFATFMTGEMNALIRSHCSVGALLRTPPDPLHVSAFDLGVNYARAGAASWLHDLFVLRAAVVTGQKSEAEVSTVLTGWLLGCEFAAALAMYPDTQKIALIASPNLVPWYQMAASRFGIECDALEASSATPNGLWKIAQALIGCK